MRQETIQVCGLGGHSCGRIAVPLLNKTMGTLLNPQGGACPHVHGAYPKAMGSNGKVLHYAQVQMHAVPAADAGEVPGRSSSTWTLQRIDTPVKKCCRLQRKDSTA